MQKIYYYGFLPVLLLAITVNLCVTVPYLRGAKVLDGATSFPGQAFLPLRPYLTQARLVGYYTDQKVPNLNLDAVFAYTFQRAQFALSPILLDHVNPWQHEYVIVYLHHPEILGKISSKFPIEIVAQLNPNILLVHQSLQ